MYSPPLTEADPTAWKARALPKAPSLPCCRPGNSGCWEEGHWRPLQGSPRVSVPPTCSGGLEKGETGPVAFQNSLFPSGSPRSHLPSWASSAGINTTKGMFSLPLGFTMCWERKNKSFIPTRVSGWRQNFPSEARKFPPAFQRRKWAEGRWAGAGGWGGMKCGVWELGGGREGDSRAP